MTSSHLTRNHTERREEDLLVTYPRLTEDGPQLVEVHLGTTPSEAQGGCLLEVHAEVIALEDAGIEVVIHQKVMLKGTEGCRHSEPPFIE